MAEDVAALTSQLAEAKARIADLEAALGVGEDTLGVAFRLPNSLKALLGCLMAMPNVTPEMIVMRLNIATDSKVAVHRLREALKPYEIEVRSKRGLGYWLDAETKERVKLLAQQVIAPEPMALSEPPAAPSIAAA